MFQQAIQDGNRGGGDGLTYNELLSSPFNDDSAEIIEVEEPKNKKDTTERK